jgi:hypothetical protein
MKYMLDDMLDNVTAIKSIRLIDTFTKQGSKSMREFLDKNDVKYTYYYFSRDNMSQEILLNETQYEPNTFPMVICDVVLTDSEFVNEVDENGEYVFEEKEDGYIYPVLKEFSFDKQHVVVYDNIEKLNKSRLLEKISELGVKDVTEEN